MEQEAVMGVRLCICMPTCNRRECIGRVLEEELEILRKTGVDLCIYDSSDDGATEQLVSDYQDKGYRNLFYRNMDHAVHPNRKAFLIFQEAEHTGYDYIWLLHDHTYCSDEKAMCRILEALSENFDFYLLNMQASGFRMTEIRSLDEFLVLGAWPLNSFGTSIVKVDSFLKGTDWPAVSGKYLRKKTLNYAHVGFYFERASQMENVRICKVELPREAFLDFLRYGKTSWDEETIRICTECWGSNIFMLPDVYKSKRQALQTQDKWFLAKYKLIFYKKSGQYGLKSFMRYQKWLRLISPESYWQDMAIAVLPFGASKYIFCHKLVKRVKNARRKHQKVLIYGAGRHAAECADLLKNIGLGFDAFIVTSKMGNPETLLGHPVCEAEDLLKQDPAFVIIAVLTSGAGEVEAYLGRLGRQNKALDSMVFE